MGSERSRATTPRPHWPLRSELLRQFAVGFMPSSVLVSKKAVPEICLLNMLPCGKTLREGKLSPVGTLEMSQNWARKRSNHSRRGPGIHPEPAAAKEQAGEGPQVVKDKRGKWKQPDLYVFNWSLKECQECIVQGGLRAKWGVGWVRASTLKLQEGMRESVGGERWNSCSVGNKLSNKRIGRNWGLGPSWILLCYLRHSTVTK